MVRPLRVGDRVVFRKGFDERVATVIEVYGQNDSQVVLMVPIRGADDEILDEYMMSLPAERIIRVEAA